MILYQHAVEQDGDIRRSLQRSIAVESRRCPHDVVGLPLAGLAIRIGQRDGLLVDAAGLAVHVGLVVVGIENLQLISVVARSGGGEEHAAIPARLTVAGDVRRNFPLEVKLVVLEGPLGFDVSGTLLLVDGQYAVGDGPFGGRLVAVRDPLVEVLAVKKHNRVGRRRRVVRARRDNLGHGLPHFCIFRSPGRFLLSRGLRLRGHLRDQGNGRDREDRGGEDS